MELIFLTYFTLEIAMKLFVFRRLFFTMTMWGWNVLDLVLVLVHLGEELIMIIANSVGWLDEDEQSPGFLLRTLRILRAIRIIRVLRVTNFALDLRLLVSCLTHSLRPFFWTLVLIFLLVYIVGIYFTQVVLVERAHGSLPPDVDGIITAKFGNVPQSALSLFQGLTGGIDWNDLAEPIIQYISPWLGLVLILYIAFASLAVLNVITGIFVESAISKADKIREKYKVLTARNLFKELDKSCAGRLSFDDVHNHLSTPKVENYLTNLDIDREDAEFLFDMLDVDSSGFIDVDEFLNGCIRLQGPAKALDLLLVTRETRSALDRNLDCMTSNHERLGQVLQKLERGHQKPKKQKDEVPVLE